MTLSSSHHINWCTSVGESVLQFPDWYLFTAFGVPTHLRQWHQSDLPGLLVANPSSSGALPLDNVFALNFPPSEIGQGVKDTCLWHSLSGEATSVSQFPVSKATRRASLRVEKFWPQRKSILSRLSICKICFPSTTWSPFFSSQVGGHTTAHGLNSSEINCIGSLVQQRMSNNSAQTLKMVHSPLALA